MHFMVLGRFKMLNYVVDEIQSLLSFTATYHVERETFQTSGKTEIHAYSVK